MIIWITGLAGAGKTTIATEVYNNLKKTNANTVFLDGDILRKVLGAYGYSYDERLAQAEKIHNLCQMLDEQEINVVCATIGQFHSIQEKNRKTFKKYCEIYLNVEMEKLIEKDKKGLYSGALSGEIKDVVGVDIIAEAPLNPEIVIENSGFDKLDEKVQVIMDYLSEHL